MNIQFTSMLWEEIWYIWHSGSRKML